MPDTREALMTYMKEHRIGVPALAARMQEACGEEVEVRTLSRFLTGEDQIVDSVVAVYRRFLDKGGGAAAS